MSQDRVLIIDQRTSYPLQVCRTLGRRGHEIHAVAEAGAGLLRSHYCARVFPTPAWYRDPAYFKRLDAVVQSGWYDVIYVCGEVVLEQLLPFIAAGGPWTAFPFGAAPSATMLFDKNAVLERVGAAGVPVPRSIVPSSETEAVAIADELGFPLVVKGEKGAAAQNVRIVGRPGDLLARYREIVLNERGYGGRPALQEFIPGPTYLVGGVFVDGEPLRIAAHRKVLMYPAAGGATVKGMSERPARLIDNALAAFRALRFTGLGSLDFLRDDRDEDFKFIEINPRPWATIGLSLACTDLLSAYHDLAKGVPGTRRLRYREGVRWHRLSGEVRLIAERPWRLPGFIADCLDPRVGSDFDWRDAFASVAEIARAGHGPAAGARAGAPIER